MVIIVDILNEIYKKLMENELISSQCADRIKFYSYPETGNKEAPFIMITPLETPFETVFASDQANAEYIAFQIDVEGTDRNVIKEIQNEIRNILKKLNLRQERGGLDTYFDETKRFVDSRRYSGLPFSLFKEVF